MNATLSQLAPFGFLGLFQLIGGLAAGYSLRKLVFDHAPAAVGMLLWGLGFGGIPMVVAFVLGSSLHQPLLALVGPVIYLGAATAGLALLPWLSQTLGSSTLVTLTVGCAFTLAGSAVLIAILRSGKGSIWLGLIFAGVFVLLGVWLCWTALVPLLQGKSLDDAPSGTTMTLTTTYSRRI